MLQPWRVPSVARVDAACGHEATAFAERECFLIEMGWRGLTIGFTAE